MNSEEIINLDRKFQQHYQNKFVVQPFLTRSIVSFQANKTRPIYRWYKYKEAFSASLVEYLLEEYQIVNSKILDPFAGSGTSLFASTAKGINADGIELLPIGQEIIKTRKLLFKLNSEDWKTLKNWSVLKPWQQSNYLGKTLPELRITKGAYPPLTQAEIEKYINQLDQENETVQAVLRLSLLCVLESVSYTRKDGQYLRWDYRASRPQGKKPFNKGYIPTFTEAICQKIDEIISDMSPPSQQLELFSVKENYGNINLYCGSCLEIMPSLNNNYYDAIITSPPYCNRYDYTRTYALELALLGVDENKLIQLRQAMLSCTVENRPKDLLTINPQWKRAIDLVENQPLLQGILSYLETQKKQGLLNNMGIPRMIRGYFSEMACLIAEFARTLKSKAPLIIVNDNVRYAGIGISVDLILADLAENLGFEIGQILVLPDDKGNSSQQMGEHGREPMRKCVYIWRKI